LEIAGNIIIIAGIIFMLFGVIGMFRFKNFYPRILVATKIDTVGAITIIIGIALRHGFSFFSGKLLFLIIIILILNPLVANVIARSAYLSGYKIEDSGTGTDNSKELQEGYHI